MSDETPASSNKPIAVEIREKSKAAVESAGEEIKQRIVDQLVEEEKTRRTTILSDAFVARETLDRDLNKMRNKPDQVFHPMTEGGEAIRFQSSETVKSISSKEEKLKNLDQAIENAITTGTNESYEKLTKATETAKK